MKDIARAAHVNQSTVSRVLGTGEGTSISAEVRKRILRIARQRDYHLNPSAVALRTGETRTVMVVVSDMTDMYYAGIISGVQEVLVAEGYSLVLHSLADAGPPENLPRFMRRYHFDGVLMLGALPGLADEFVTSLAGKGLPLVLVGRDLKSASLPSVTAANREGGRLAAEHLYNLGHRRVAVMRGPRGWPDITQRIEGFRSEIRKQGGSADSLLLFSSASRRSDSGFEATKKLLAGRKPTALFCMNDATAAGALRAVREAGLRVPADISVVGFDDSEIAEYTCPPLTSVRQPRVQMGKEGATQLMEAMQGRRASSRVLDVELILRESTCPRR
jgi:DNA-binding LacI/PurR family transcriptional regulator